MHTSITWTSLSLIINFHFSFQITARRQWKNVYDELGGNPGSTSAATCTRRHYERLVFSFLISQCWFWKESADFCGTDVKWCWVLNFCWWLNKYLDKTFNKKKKNRRDVAILRKSFCEILHFIMLMCDRMCPLKYMHWPCCWFHYLHPILLAAPHESCVCTTQRKLSRFLQIQNKWCFYNIQRFTLSYFTVFIISGSLD